MGLGVRTTDESAHPRRLLATTTAITYIWITRYGVENELMPD
jgi:hypothetical protein